MGSNVLCASLGFVFSIFLIWVIYFAHSLSFKRASEQKKALKLVQGTVQTLLPFRPHESAGLWLLGLFRWTFAKPPYENDNAYRVLKQSHADIHYPFEKWHLSCYLVLDETEYLNMGHQVTRQAEMTVTNQVLCDPQSSKVGHEKQHSIIKW